jgi:ankyrin repeat protein
MENDLHDAAAAGNVAEIRALLTRGADVNAVDGDGRTPIMVATHARQTTAVQVLVDAGADVNQRDRMLDNPFLYAGAEGLLDILMLVHTAADTRLTNRYGGTALIPACERGHEEVARFLLDETDVDANHVNNLGWTALLEAVLLSDGGPRHQRIVRLLLDHSADPNLPDKDGVTPLRHAHARGYAEIQRLLESRGGR